MDAPDWIIEITEETRCEYCGVEIVYAKTKRGQGVFDAETWRPHRLSCPYAEKWSKVKREKKRQSRLEDFGILRDDI